MQMTVLFGFLDCGSQFWDERIMMLKVWVNDLEINCRLDPNEQLKAWFIALIPFCVEYMVYQTWRPYPLGKLYDYKDGPARSTLMTALATIKVQFCKRGERLWIEVVRGRTA